MILCDGKRNPQAEVTPYYGCHNDARKIKMQIQWEPAMVETIWTRIVKEKISNQAMLLEKTEHDEYKMLCQYVEEVQPGDVTNREGHAAKVYFNALFGKKFSRDDEENVRAYIRKLIEQQNEECQITEYASGEELLQAEKENSEKIDVLFLDIAMGDIDGMSVAKQLRQIQADKEQAAWGSLPLLIFVTGYSEYMPDAFSVNAFQYIVKPIKKKDFVNVLSLIHI